MSHDLCKACGRHACVCSLGPPVIRDVIGDQASWEPGGTASVLTAAMLGQLPDVVLINFSHSTFFINAGIAPMATLEIERRKALES